MSAPSSLVVALLAIASSGASCGTSPSSPRSVPLAQEFTLSPGETARVEGADLTVTFESVSADSRCPQGVNCVWEGEAVVLVSLRVDDQPAARRELRTPADSEAEAGAYRVRLVGLAPLPRAGASPAPGEYRATFLVNRT
jgi:hypothetical protein